jgi:hypothetical protein
VSGDVGVAVGFSRAFELVHEALEFFEVVGLLEILDRFEVLCEAGVERGENGGDGRIGGV